MFYKFCIKSNYVVVRQMVLRIKECWVREEGNEIGLFIILGAQNMFKKA